MQRNLRASLLLLAILFASLHVHAVTDDARALVGEVLLEYVWDGEATYTRVWIGNERVLSGYGGVERFILGTKGAWLQRWHETKLFPIEQFTWIELIDTRSAKMDEAVDKLRQRADWHEELPEIGDWRRLNFTYDLGSRATTTAASEAMLSDDYLVIVDSDKARAILLNRSIVERIEWPDGEMEVAAKARVAHSVPTRQVSAGPKALELSVVDVKVSQWGDLGSSKLPQGHPARPIEEPSLVITLLAEPMSGTLEGVKWGRGQVEDIFDRHIAMRTPQGSPTGLELEAHFVGLRSLVEQQTFTLTFELTLPDASVPTTYTFELEVPQALKEAQFPYLPTKPSMADFFTYEAGILEQFISDVRTRNDVHVHAWLESSRLNYVYELLMRETFDIVDVVYTPISGGDQLAAILMMYDRQEFRFREFAVFFRYSEVGWRLYGFYEKVPAHEGGLSTNQ